jgi:hypothetical protein
MQAWFKRSLFFSLSFFALIEGITCYSKIADIYTNPHLSASGAALMLYPSMLYQLRMDSYNVLGYAQLR